MPTYLVAQLVKNPPAMWETPVRFLGQEDLLEKQTVTHSSILVWRIPWTDSSILFSVEQYFIVCTTIYLSTPLLKDTLVASKFW